MLITVRPLSGQDSTFDVDPGEYVDSLKQRIQDRLGVPTDQQRLIFAGKQLESGRSLADYSIQNGSVIRLVLRQRTSAVTTYASAGLSAPRRGRSQVLQLSAGEQASQRIYGVTGGYDVALAFSLRCAGTFTWTVTYLAASSLEPLGSNSGTLSTTGTGLEAFETQLSAPTGTVAVDLVLAASGDAAFIDRVGLWSTAPPVPRASSPLGLQATPGDGFVNLSWQPPAGSDPTTLGYLVSWGSPIKSATLYATSIGIPLPNGEPHRFSVRALGPGGMGVPAKTRIVRPRQATVTSLSSDVAGATTADVVTFTATCSVASGQVAFLVDGRVIGTVDLVDSVAQLAHRFPRVGDHSVSAILRASSSDASSSDSMLITITAAS